MVRRRKRAGAHEGRTRDQAAAVEEVVEEEAVTSRQEARAARACMGRRAGEKRVTPEEGHVKKNKWRAS